jgi:DNA helicase-2/ATP-dependent DNA helicase PcrA
VLRDYEHQRGQRFTLIEGVNEDAFSKSAILRSLYKEINGSSLNDDELETLTNEIGLVKNKMLKEKDFKTEDLQTHNFPLIYKAYEEFKKSRALIDFDDMLTHALTILRRYPDILAWYQTKYTYFQVDEAQDLSRIQFEILKMLAGRSRNIFLVADDDQSIYGFRGAESRHILNIRGIYPDCTVYYLENNYRSSRDIVALTSSFIRHNENRFDKNHFTQNGPGPAPYIYAFEDVADQNSFVVKRIKALLAENPNMSIAVLFRTNLSSIALLDAFDRAGVLLSLRQNKVYFNRHWLVQDILAFLRLSLDPSDKESLLRIYYKMNRFISKSMVEAAVLQGDCNLLETIGREEGSNPAHQKSLQA